MSYMENPKEVDFHHWCKRCVHEDKEGWQSPCNECLEQPMNEGTTKPVEYKEKD